MNLHAMEATAQGANGDAGQIQNVACLLFEPSFLTQLCHAEPVEEEEAAATGSSPPLPRPATLLHPAPLHTSTHRVEESPFPGNPVAGGVSAVLLWPQWCH